MRSRSIARILALTATATLVAASCGGSDGVGSGAGSSDASTETTEASGTAAPTAGADTPATVNDSAPEILQFTNALVGGGELDASTLAGKPTAFWFWAPT